MKAFTSKRTGYTAFLSHNHRDKLRVQWLGRLLHAYWVPGKPRRRVFLDANTLVAASLNDGIRKALDESEYLVVCASEGVIDSRWVSDEIDHFLAKTERQLDRVLICRVGHDGEGEAKVAAWIEALETRLGRKPGDHLVPDVREVVGADADSAALSLLAPMLGMADKGALLDRRARFLAKAWRAGVCILAALLLLWACVWKWLQTPEGAMWSHQHAVITKASRLKFDYPRLVGPAVLALARAGESKKAHDLAMMVKGKPFHAAMILAIEAGRLSPRPEAVRSLMDAAGDDAGAGFPIATLIGFHAVGESKYWEQARKSHGSMVGSEEWVKNLAEAGLWNEAMTAWEKWREEHADETMKHFSLWMELHLLAGKPLSAKPEMMSAWLAGMKKNRSIYEAQTLFSEAAMLGRLNEPAWRQLLSHAVESTQEILSTGYDPGCMAQPLAAMTAMAGMIEEARELLQLTQSVKNDPRDNSAAEPLAFRALAEHALGNEKASEELFAAAIEAANAPIEASRTWGEHFAVSRALVMAGQWKKATELPAMIGAEMTQRELELELIVWWQKHNAPPGLKSNR